MEINLKNKEQALEIAKAMIDECLGMSGRKITKDDLLFKVMYLDLYEKYINLIEMREKIKNG